MTSNLIFTPGGPFGRLLQRCDCYAKAAWPILILGETGVGKELIARRIHDQSSRSSGPFIPINCGAVPAGLFESELFGHESGAFSGATRAHKGLLRAASGGTMFFDEIGDLELGLQVKLLRLLDSGELRAVGATRFETVDVRILAATNVDLKTAIGEGRFRLDLYERLSVLTLTIPPLRDRTEDIEKIARGFLNQLGISFEQEAVEALLNFPWPGNVRQLRNLLARAGVLGAKRVTRRMLERLLCEERRLDAYCGQVCDLSERPLADIEKQVILDRLYRYEGNRKRTAKELGIAKSTLQEKLRRWNQRGDSARDRGNPSANLNTR